MAYANLSYETNPPHHIDCCFICISQNSLKRKYFLKIEKHGCVFWQNILITDCIKIFRFNHIWESDMQMKQHNLWHSTDVTNTRTFLQRTTRLRMLPTMPRQEVTTVATPEIQNISLCAWQFNCSRRILWCSQSLLKAPPAYLRHYVEQMWSRREMSWLLTVG